MDTLQAFNGRKTGGRQIKTEILAGFFYLDDDSLLFNKRSPSDNGRIGSFYCLDRSNRPVSDYTALTYIETADGPRIQPAKGNILSLFFVRFLPGQNPLGEKKML